MLRPTPLRPLTKALQQPLITIIGATGTGKSQLAVDLAVRFNGEIINADAMQMYEGLDIITNKMKFEERKGVRHHLLGVLGKDKEGVWEREVRIGVWERKAVEAIEDIRSRGKLPILVGGTHYYIQALLFPGSILDSGGLNDSMSEEIVVHENQVDKINSEELGKKYPILNASTSEILTELQKVDPVMAARWHPNDHRKIKRSLEIYYLNNGTPASDVYSRQQENISQSRFRNLVFWVHSDTAMLNERLRKRVDKMIEQGMFEEIKELYMVYKMLNERGETVDLQRGVWQSIGFKEFLNYLPYLEMEEENAVGEERISKEELGKMKDECVTRMVNVTTRYAKQQVKWIRIKFMHALRAANSVVGDDDVHKLYLLDSTHIPSYDDKVLHPAITVTNQFLGDCQETRKLGSACCCLPDPLSLSPLAAEMLKLKRDYDLATRPDLWAKNHCELCGVTTTDVEGWEKHVSSGRHKRNMKRRKKREEALRWKERRMRGELGKGKETIEMNDLVSGSGSESESEIAGKEEEDEIGNLAGGAGAGAR